MTGRVLDAVGAQTRAPAVSRESEEDALPVYIEAETGRRSEQGRAGEEAAQAWNRERKGHGEGPEGRPSLRLSENGAKSVWLEERRETDGERWAGPQDQSDDLRAGCPWPCLGVGSPGLRLLSRHYC